jgi:hypothetical protein
MNRKRSIYSVLLFAIPLVCEACVTPVTPHLNANDTKPLLAVEGQITDQEGPFSVKLTTTAPVNDLSSPEPVLNAVVNVIDDQGHSYQLYGDSNGVYESVEKNLKGIPGNRYTLTITTPEDGREYTSMPVLMQPVPGIDSLYFQEVKHPRITQGLAFEDNWLNILVDTHDAEEKTKYWRWEFEETFEVNLIADPVQVYHDPFRPEVFSFVHVLPSDDKKICWATKPSALIVVANTVNHPINELKGFIVQSIGPGDARLHIRYSILVKQYSLDRDLYNYWKLMKDINENPGGIYNKIPSPVYGNITCCGGNSKALGYFAASSVREKRMFINRSDHHVETINVTQGCPYFSYYVDPPRPMIFFGVDILRGYIVYTSSKGCADCTMDYGTNVKPSFW